MHEAIVKGDATAVKTFLSYGADPNGKTQKGRTPLFYTLIAGFEQENQSNLVDIIHILRSKGLFLIPVHTDSAGTAVIYVSIFFEIFFFIKKCSRGFSGSLITNLTLIFKNFQL